MPCSNQVTPLFHRSSSETHNEHFAALKQGSRTHLLSLSSDLPIHPCGIFLNVHPRTLLTSRSLVITRAQTQDAQVLCNAGKQNARRIRTIELTTCGKRAIFPKNRRAVSSLIRSHMLCPRPVHSQLHKPKCKCASFLQALELNAWRMNKTLQLRHRARKATFPVHTFAFLLLY